MPVAPLPRRDDLLLVNPVEGAHRVGLRAGISVLVPLLLLVATGHAAWVPYASFGAFTSLYGRNQPHLVRLQMQASIALCLTAAVVTGVVVGLVPGALWLQVLTAPVIAATGQVVAKAHSYHPPGPLFLIFAFGAISSMPHTVADLAPAVLVTSATALFCLAVGIAGGLRHPRAALAGAHWLPLHFQANWQPLWMALAVLISGALAILLGIGHPYWAMVSAIAPLSAPDVTQQITRGIHRTIGTTGGIVTSWMLLALHLERAAAVLVVAALQFGAEMLVGRNYALALLCITPLALMMGQLVHPQPIAPLLVDRLIETVIGSTVGMGLVLLGHHLRERRNDEVAERLEELRASREG